MVQEQAKKYLSLGWSVFPLAPKSKTPNVKWNQYRTQRMTPDEVNTMFRHDSNIALVCGELSGILVVDQDSYKGKAGFENVDSPLKAITARGGMHVYFKYTPGLQNTVNEAKGTDIRSEGGYVVMPPSVVEYEKDGTKSQGAYIWVTEPTKELLDTLPEAPEALIREIYGQNTQSSTPALKPVSTAEIGEDWGAVAEGGRNNEISRFALKYLNKYKDVTAVWNLILARNARFQPPLPLKELERTFQSAVNKFTASPPQKPASHITNDLLSQVREDNPYVKTKLGDDVDFTIQQLVQGKKKGYSTGYLELDALVGGFIPSQSYLIYADTNVGKSVFSLNVLVSMAKRGVKCLYFDLENDTALSTERLMLVANAGKVHLQDYRAQLIAETVDIDYLKSISAPVMELEGTLDVWSMTKMLDRFGEINWAGIKTVINEHIPNGLQVVVIDHLHYFSPAETDHSVLGEIARQINNMSAEANLAVVCVAHTKKGLFDTNKNKSAKADDDVRTFRPTIDHISGSAMIAKHFKNLIAIQRNYTATDDTEQNRTVVYVDKTKYGPSGKFELSFDPMKLLFKTWTYEEAYNKTKLAAMDEMLEEEVTLPLEAAVVKTPATIQEVKVEEVDDDVPVPVAPPPKIPAKQEEVKVIDDADLSDIPF